MARRVLFMCRRTPSTQVALSIAQFHRLRRWHDQTAQPKVHSGQLDDCAALDLNVRARKQVRHVKRPLEKTPPLCSRRHLHRWHLTSGAWSKRLPGNGLGRLTSSPATLQRLDGGRSPCPKSRARRPRATSSREIARRPAGSGLRPGGAGTGFDRRVRSSDRGSAREARACA